MLVTRYLFCYALVWGLSTLSLSAQWGQTGFTAYGLEAGLVNGTVQSISQDEQGFMWIGTRNGLHRFDAYDFTVFQHDPEDSLSLQDNGIYHLAPGPKGGLFVGMTDQGIAYYDPATGFFHRHQHDPEDSSSLATHRLGFKSLYVDQAGDLWITHAKGFDKLVGFDPDQPDRWEFAHYQFSLDWPTGYSGTTLSLYIDKKGLFWFCLYGGLVLYDPQQDTVLAHFTHDPDDPLSLSSNFVMAAQEDSFGNFWVSTNDRGVNQLQLTWKGKQPQIAANIRHMAEKSRIREAGQYYSLAHGSSTWLSCDGRGRAWIGTSFGVSRHDPFHNRLESYFPDQHNPRSLSHNSVRALFADQAGNMWIGGDLGVNVWNLSQAPIHHYLPPSNQEELEQYMETNVFLEDRSGNLWVGSYGGLYVLTPGPEGTSYRNIPLLHGQVVQGLAEAANGDLWIMYWGGLYHWDRQHDRYTRYTYKPTERQQLSMYTPASMLQDQQGQLWIAGHLGVLQFDPQSKTFTEHLLPLPQRIKTYAVSLLEDRQGNFWVGSGHDLYLLDRQTGIYTPFTGYPGKPMSLKGKYPRQLQQDARGRIWIGARSGLYCLDPEQQSLRQFDQKDGLLSELIRSVAIDQSGGLWVCTDPGISYYEEAEDRFRHLLTEDGLIQEFYSRAQYINRQGQLFFGGVAGFNSFHPDSIAIRPPSFPVQLTGFLLNNEPVPIRASRDPSEPGFSLPKAISLLEHLDLSYRERVFTFEFSALDFHTPQTKHYAYRMLGFDSTWRNTHAGRRLATYTNLDPGQYTFEVKAADSQGAWSPQLARIGLTISPPWWKSGWAYTGYILLGLALLYALFRLRMNQVRREMRVQARIQQAKVEERETVRARSSRDFHDEAGNKITKISLYAGLLKKKAADPEMDEYIDQVSVQVQQLREGMRDFIWVLDPEQDSLPQTLQRIVDFGYQLFQHSDIKFMPDQELPPAGDLRLEVQAKRNLLLIFKEAMHNCLKYAQAHTVRFSANYEAPVLRLSLQDDGLGFDKNTLVRVNGLNNMQQRAREMGANLHVEATPGMGTHIRLEMGFHPNGL